LYSVEGGGKTLKVRFEDFWIRMLLGAGGGRKEENEEPLKEIIRGDGW